MNIFYLDEDIVACARSHADCHVVKMILESAQMLCAVLNVNGIDAPYRSTHIKHPCTIWAGASLDNWLWLRKLTLALDEEYRYRFVHSDSHRSAQVVSELTLPPIQSIGLTEHAQAMPEQYKIPSDPISAYRHYYLNEKSHLLKYTRREAPIWVQHAAV